ncbi:MAG: hypothetical protein K0Q66_1031 [Chitinophagaceae bacterium]|nr:hypothetical protein [Chitinophagaceae bacterium]
MQDDSCINLIKISNHSDLPLKFDTIIIKDANLIQKITAEAKKLKEITKTEAVDSWGEPATKSNFGYYAVGLFCNGEMVTEIDIYYTVYTGVVLMKNMAYYKNDDFEAAVLFALQDNL